MAPRPHADRLRPEAFPLRESLQARYGDMDVNGHLNNLALEALHEDMRARLNRAAFPDIYDVGSRYLRVVTAQNVVHFLAEAHWPAEFDAAAGVSKVGRSSIIASTALFIGDSCISICDTALVLVGSSGPEEIPDANRGVLQSLMISTSSPRKA
ncbi:acyl-CoA thioesterase [Mycobacterium sp. E796]|uniref:acyl-CoA thioesterase n=1 Tax=Mycobacterium sp. E796 TaxID=1834151 RepID=UPI001E415AC3|nr:acyl-CoA thioesterase [Mycobacterium sp. E796]